MKKKTKAKEKQEQRKPPIEKSNLKKEESTPDSENPFDLGGLPQRDLKKNLGCG